MEHQHVGFRNLNVYIAFYSMVYQHKGQQKWDKSGWFLGNRYDRQKGYPSITRLMIFLLINPSELWLQGSKLGGMHYHPSDWAKDEVLFDVTG